MYVIHTYLRTYVRTYVPTYIHGLYYTYSGITWYYMISIALFWNLNRWLYLLPWFGRMEAFRKSWKIEVSRWRLLEVAIFQKIPGFIVFLTCMLRPVGRNSCIILLFPILKRLQEDKDADHGKCTFQAEKWWEIRVAFKMAATEAPSDHAFSISGARGLASTEFGGYLWQGTLLALFLPGYSNIR